MAHPLLDRRCCRRGLRRGAVKQRRAGSRRSIGTTVDWHDTKPRHSWDRYRGRYGEGHRRSGRHHLELRDQRQAAGGVRTERHRRGGGPHQLQQARPGRVATRECPCRVHAGRAEHEPDPERHGREGPAHWRLHPSERRMPEQRTGVPVGPRVRRGQLRHRR